MRVMPEDMLHGGVLITLGNGRGGSGFLFNSGSDLWLVTAKHVLFNPADGALWHAMGELITYGRDYKTRWNIAVDLTDLELQKNVRPHGTADVAVVKLAKIIVSGGTGPRAVSDIMFIRGVTASPADKSGGGGLLGVGIGRVSRYESVLVSNDVFVLGYPNAIGVRSKTAPPEFDLTRPLLRKGVVAGINASLKTIIIDCPVYQGNSGGLVVEVRQPNVEELQFWTIGVVSRFIPFVEEFESKQYRTINISVENSGYTVVEPMDPVLELMSER